VYRSEAELRVMRRRARLLRFLNYIIIVDGWLVSFGNVLLAMAGETDKISSGSLALLAFLATVVVSLMLRQLADQLERGEWP